MSTHTPGLWIVNAGGDIVSTSPVNIIASVRFMDMDGVSPLPQRANAYLIAAAPELLEALEVAKICLKENRGPSMDEFKQIQGAIAKAKGLS